MLFDRKVFFSEVVCGIFIVWFFVIFFVFWINVCSFVVVEYFYVMVVWINEDIRDFNNYGEMRN